MSTQPGGHRRRRPHPSRKRHLLLPVRLPANPPPPPDTPPTPRASAPRSPQKRTLGWPVDSRRHGAACGCSISRHHGASWCYRIGSRHDSVVVWPPLRWSGDLGRKAAAARPPVQPRPRRPLVKRERAAEARGRGSVRWGREREKVGPAGHGERGRRGGVCGLDRPGREAVRHLRACGPQRLHLGRVDGEGCGRALSGRAGERSQVDKTDTGVAIECPCTRFAS